MAVPFARGFNDAFHSYAAGNDADIAFQRAREPWASHHRYWVSWAHVQQWGPNSYHWTAQPGDLGFPGWSYEKARAESNERDLRTLPLVAGCPTGWIPENERAACRPDLRGQIADWELIWYPTSAQAIDYFATFCVETLKYFDACHRVDAIEVWNEPNLPLGGMQMPVYHFRQILGAVCTKVAAANAAGYFSHPMKVISGGLYMDYQGESWKSYLNFFENVHPALEIGIHPYDTRDHQGYAWDQAADRVVARVIELWEQAVPLTGRDLWVTETGASSRHPFTREGQKRALRKLVGRASNGGYFATRSRCKGVFLHRLYPAAHGQGQEEGPDEPFYQFSLLDPTWAPKEAWWMLVDEWGP